MKSSILILALAALALGSAGCVEFRQPKEFKNRKMKEDPPLLNELPWQTGPRMAARRLVALHERA